MKLPDITAKWATLSTTGKWWVGGIGGFALLGGIAMLQDEPVAAVDYQTPRTGIAQAAPLSEKIATADVTAEQTGPAQANTGCNPPPLGMGYNQWFQMCEAMLENMHQTQNPYRIVYPEYVRMMWQMYDLQSHPENYPNLAGSACSPEGSGFMNPSGHAQICRGGRWTVGSN